ncbi:chaperonin 10-like protein [Aspergillus cavernicola]|uniref:Chaperonin 10-like protein n=1 Tax=Aspergillus cavernicola TaxID=176166 RepID=A0ABR4IS24_9EURO
MLEVLAFWKFLASPDPIFFFPSSSTLRFFSFFRSQVSISLSTCAFSCTSPSLSSNSNTLSHIITMSFLRSVKNLAPLLDRVLVQRVKPEAKTASGIFLPESSVKEQNEAKVLAVGPGALDRSGQRLPMGVIAGDRVLIPQFGGSPVKIGEEEYTLFRDSEILAKISEQGK